MAGLPHFKNSTVGRNLFEPLYLNQFTVIITPPASINNNAITPLLVEHVKEITGSIFPNVHIDKIRHQIENKITNFLPINNLYVGTSLTPECGKNRWWDTDND